MSNIPDITSLSDLLNTSPSQPSVESQQNRNPDILLDQVDQNSHKQIHEYTSDNSKQKLEDDGDIDSDNGDMQLQLPKSELPDDKIEELEKLLNQQSIKLDLSNERNDLIKEANVAQKFCRGITG